VTALAGWRGRAVLAVWLAAAAAAGPAAARAPDRTAVAPDASCARAAAIAEAEANIPAGLLLAIGQIESGRDDAAGRSMPWPWTVQDGATGRFLDSADAAVDAVRRLRAAGERSIDIGCFQMNLLHHPDAFADLASGFDPLANARAAAGFLAGLHAELGSWERAVAAYHSRTEALGGPYRDHVLSAWHGAPPGAVISAGFARTSGVRVWGPAGCLWPPALSARRKKQEVLF
jgi:hypothetical protein